MLLAGRWIDRDAGTWTGLVRYQREGLLCERWVNGDLPTLRGEAAAPTPKD
jgi:hypothetical protein